MIVTRLELADAASPDRLALEIFRHEPNLAIPVPIEELCKQLDITDICALMTEGYEGGLITDVDKHNGVILFNARSPSNRRRFTIAHELGHFLMPWHLPPAEGRFLCSQADMFRMSSRDADRRVQMEIEANRFASRILLPARDFRMDVAKTKDPDLAAVAKLSQKYEVSKEAVSRAYVDFRAEPTAILVVKDHILLRAYTNQKFPFLSVPRGKPLPRQSVLLRRRPEVGVASVLDETDAGVWINVERGTRAPNLYEQVFPQSAGYALILLTIEEHDDDILDYDAERTAKERYRDRLSRYH
jgi:Zn-dependent peptidase ImmA (M78 family)